MLHVYIDLLLPQTVAVTFLPKVFPKSVSNNIQIERQITYGLCVNIQGDETTTNICNSSAK